MPKRRVRVLRIIEYIGDQEAIMKSLERRQLKGEMVIPDYTIRETFVGFGDVFGALNYAVPEPEDD